MLTLEAIVQAAGFESESEFNRLVGLALLRTARQRVAFKRWQRADGTKEGLLKLCETTPEEVSHGHPQEHAAPHPLYRPRLRHRRPAPSSLSASAKPGSPNTGRQSGA